MSGSDGIGLNSMTAEQIAWLEQESLRMAIETSRLTEQPRGASPPSKHTAPKTYEEEAQLLECAIAISLQASLSDDSISESTEKGNLDQLAEDERLAQELQDEQLAKMLQEEEQGLSSTNTATGHHRTNGGSSINPHPGPSNQSGGRGRLSRFASGRQCDICRQCLGHKALIFKGKHVHPECFKCCDCNRPITEPRYMEKDDQVYHPECYKQRFNPRCQICEEFIPPDPDGHIRYIEHPFFKDKYCRRHRDDETPKCTACTRQQERSCSFASLADGRHLCLSCLGSVVVDTNDVQPLYTHVIDFFSRRGLPLPQKPPLYLVDQGTLNESQVSEGRGHGGGLGGEGLVRGLCISHQRVIQTVVRTPQVTRTASGRTVQVGSLKQNIQQPVSATVTAILVLYGFPRLLCGSIIAHECMHAYLRLAMFPSMELQIEEGLCQLMAQLWLEEEVPKAADGDLESGSYFAHAIQTDSSTIYGDGFRAALAAYKRVGLTQLLNHVRQCGQLPL